MLLRHAVQHRRTIFWRGIPKVSNSTKATNSNPSGKETKKRKKQVEASNFIRSSSKINDTGRKNRANEQNIWNMLGRAVDESDSLPQAQDSSWKNPNKFNKEKHGPKARLFSPSSMQDADHYTHRVMNLIERTGNVQRSCLSTKIVPLGPPSRPLTDTSDTDHPRRTCQQPGCNAQCSPGHSTRSDSTVPRSLSVAPISPVVQYRAGIGRTAFCGWHGQEVVACYGRQEDSIWGTYGCTHNTIEGPCGA
jgi:hypothetical protein